MIVIARYVMSKLMIHTHIAWAPFYERGKFLYWVECGRGTIKLRGDGTAAAMLYNDRHASGGSIWTHLLPIGETPDDPKPEAEEEAAKRPGQSANNDEDEEI